MDKDKGKEAAVKKNGGKAEKAVVSVPLSSLRGWEREFDRMFEDFPFLHWPRFFREMEPFRFRRGIRLQAPAVDMYDEKTEVVVKAEMPGMEKDDIEISLTDSTLTLKGEKKKEEEVKEKDYYRSEREYGSFLRSITLPADVKTEEAKATFKNGVLEIHLPKTEEAKRKETVVKVQ
jgi:HSP20 family protein